MSAPPNTEKPASTEPSADQQNKNPQLGALEEDDEFEEFPAADWDDSETALAQLNADANSGGKNGSGLTDQLWEDNWDDDDIEDDFSNQLRAELAKVSGGAAASADQPMS
ncbi:hypothetical protein FRC03_010422 [Tulasnella sp. 419]|nr:hypothetical protein FRC02_007319 [Tulasnella sp. 418]KAG8970232.1 hypothetical protein FRC03_010422 [Tulasnella sp. 419]